MWILTNIYDFDFRSKRRRRSPRRQCSKDYDCALTDIYNQSKQYDCVPANHIYSQSKPAIIQSAADMDIIPTTSNQETGGQNQTSLYSFLPYNRVNRHKKLQFQPQIGSNMDKQYIYMPCVPKLPQDISEVNTEELPAPNEQCTDSCDCQDSQSCHCPDVIPSDAEV